MKEIRVNDFEGIKIAQVEDSDAATGLTVFVSECGMRAGLSVRGGGPASRESELLKPLASAEKIHAVVLGGGSAFGLNAAGGVMKALEERGIGFDVGVAKVPLVVQSDLFDLTVASAKIRPNEKMGYDAACLALTEPNYKDGNFGAGCGATVGKICGMERCTKTGIGSYAVQIADLKVGAVVALNALGDVFDYKNGKQIAGLLNEEKNAFASTEACMAQRIERVENRFVSNTTIAVVMTNAGFNKTSLCKIADMAHDGYARSIRPVHTGADGDSIYALSLGEVNADQDLVGVLSANVVSEAIIRAVQNATTAYGYVCASELEKNK